jgi:regulation of enolase protein 1 (concanavalin A-like superfamily)
MILCTRSSPITRRRVLFVALFAATSFATLAQGGSLGQFDDHADVGAPAIAGTATYDAGSQAYTVAAGGVNMWGQRDEFHFVWKRITGDFTIQARVALVGTGVNGHRKAGLMVRPNQDADAPYVDGIVHGDGLTSLQFRRTRGAITEEQRVTTAGAEILKLERKGNTYTFSAAKSGESFMTTELADIALGDTLLVGLVVCSHDAGVTEKAIFKDLKIND